MTAVKANARILLDVAMAAVLITLYNKNVISLMYHEIAGLIILLPFCVHLAFNWKWVAGLFKKGLGRGVTGRMRCLAIVNILLVAAWIAVFATGILVSKKLFPFQIMALNPWHFFVSALALIMTGIHFGLNWDFFWGFIGKKIRIPQAAAVCLTALVLIFGCYSAGTSGFGRWLAAPFISMPGNMGMHGGGQGMGRGRMQLAEKSPAGEAFPALEKIIEENGEAVAAPVLRQPMQGNAGMPPRMQPFTISRFLSVIASCFSLLFLFAAAAHYLEKLLKRKRAGNRHSG